ncbi:MAG: class II histone deacetylase [Pseudomonadota bacterium]
MTSATRRTGWVCHELYFWHNTLGWNQFFEPGLTIQPGEHAENAETKRRFRNLVEVSGMLDRLHPIAPVSASNEALLRIHTQAHLDHIAAVSAGGGGDAGEGTPMGRDGEAIARLSAGGAISAVDAVIGGKVDNAYVLCRPPGHHAMPEKAMGFCFYSNAAVAVAHARAVHGLKRVAVVDWDVHHGNGTEAAFYADPDVLTISLHQDRLYPETTGDLGDVGEGAGEGANMNVPLPAGSGEGAYLAAMERVVLPALRRHRPELILIASGFDASAMDPLGRMMLSSEAFRKMSEAVVGAAEELCGGRLVATHEGGYSAAYVPYCGLATLEAMSGFATGVADPWLPSVSIYGGQGLTPHQAAAVDAAVERHGL